MTNAYKKTQSQTPEKGKN